jgi:hypothetical protein
MEKREIINGCTLNGERTMAVWVWQDDELVDYEQIPDTELNDCSFWERFELRVLMGQACLEDGWELVE